MGSRKGNEYIQLATEKPTKEEKIAQNSTNL